MKKEKAQHGTNLGRTAYYHRPRHTNAAQVEEATLRAVAAVEGGEEEAEAAAEAAAMRRANAAEARAVLHNALLCNKL